MLIKVTQNISETTTNSYEIHAGGDANDDDKRGKKSSEILQ